MHNTFSLVRAAKDSYLYYSSLERTFIVSSTNFNIKNILTEEVFKNSDRSSTCKQKKLRAIDIIPGNNCNLRCSYCYRKCDSKTINIDSLKLGLDFIQKLSNQDNLEFCFIGGEPLLYFDKIKESVKYILANFPRAKFVIVSNGTLFSEEICTFLSEKKFYIIVSIDGKKERHDLARVLKSNERGSFDLVDEGLALLHKHNLDYAFCMTIGEHNCKSFEEDVEWLLEQYIPNDLHVNGILHKKNQNMSLVENFALGLTHLFDKFNKKKMPLPNQLKRWFLPFLSHSERMHFDCAAFGQKIVLSPTGYHVCEGFISNGKTVSLSDIKKTLKQWSAYSQNRSAFCKKCTISLICKGGCKFNASQYSLNDSTIDMQYCITNKILFEHLADNIINDFSARDCEYCIYNETTLLNIWPAIATPNIDRQINWS